MQQRSFSSFLVAGVIVLLLTGIGGYFWLMRSSPLNVLGGGSNTTTAAAIFVPRQAPVMVSLLVNPERIEALGQDEVKTSLLANTGLDYRRDIKPWLDDEITLAVTSEDIDRDPKNGKQPGYLMALATKAPEKSREFLNLLFSQRAIAGTELMVEQYQGVKLISDYPRPQPEAKTALEPSSNSSGKMLAGAAVGDRFILFANHPKVLRDAINNVQAPDLNLTSSSQYQQAIAQLPAKKIGLAYLNLPSLAAWRGLEPETQTPQTQLIALELNRQGLLAQTTLLSPPEQEITPTTSQLSEAVGALKYLPANTGFSISGTDLSHLENTHLSQIWTQVVATLLGAKTEAISQVVNQPLAELEKRWGINLQQEIFSWVKGEYAIGLLPHNQSANDWIFVAEKTDAAQQGISHLDDIAAAQGLSITAIPLEEQKVFAWTQLTTTPASNSDSDRTSITLKAKVQGIHTTVGNYEIFTTSIEAMNAALKAAKSGALINSPKFKASINALPKPNQGYVYLDWRETQEILERQFPILKLLEVAGNSFFSHLRSLTVSSYGSDTGLPKAGVFFRLDN